MANSKGTKTSRARSDAAIAALRAYGLGFPGAHLKSPWPGHEDLAVKDKTFAYLPTEGDPFSISCKLPRSCAVALMLPFCEPTAYGLGKAGWVSATPAPGQIDLEMFKQWIDESYRAQAPKKLVAQLDGGPPTKPAARPPVAKQPVTAKRTRKR